MQGRTELLLKIAPGLFVLIWSTGWISARYAAPYADPLTFLSLRYACAGFILASLAIAMGAIWPRGKAAGHAAISGVLLHALYLGGVWWAIARGLPAGISGLIAAVQPILTALLAPLVLGERISPRHWAGIGLGFVGIVLVLWPKLAGLSGSALAQQIEPLAVNVLGMVAVTAGTFYQKKYVQTGDLRTITTLQYAGAFAVTLPLAVLTEPMRIQWNTIMVLNLGWAVFALSIGAIGLLLLLIRRGAVSRAAALIYLVPPSVALEAYLLFGETMSALQVAGMIITAFGVALAVKR